MSRRLGPALKELGEAASPRWWCCSGDSRQSHSIGRRTVQPWEGRSSAALLAAVPPAATRWAADGKTRVLEYPFFWGRTAAQDPRPGAPLRAYAPACTPPAPALGGSDDGRGPGGSPRTYVWASRAHLGLSAWVPTKYSAHPAPGARAPTLTASRTAPPEQSSPRALAPPPGPTRPPACPPTPAPPSADSATLSGRAIRTRRPRGRLSSPPPQTHTKSPSPPVCVV